MRTNGLNKEKVELVKQFLKYYPKYPKPYKESDFDKSTILHFKREHARYSPFRRCVIERYGRAGAKKIFKCGKIYRHHQKALNKLAIKIVHEMKQAGDW